MFTKDMRVSEIVAEFPVTGAVFLQYGVPCFGNLGTELGTLEQAAQACSVGLESLIRDLNRATRIAEALGMTED
jgi:hypothetical protein